MADDQKTVPNIYFPSPNAVKVFEAVHKAQEVLANHIEPGGPTAEETINELLGILDDHRLVMALELAHFTHRDASTSAKTASLGQVSRLLIRLPSSRGARL